MWCAARYYPLENVSAPTQLTLDKSIDPIAYSVFPMSSTDSKDNHSNFVNSPYNHGTDLQLRELRAAYYAAVSWADFATGKILDELDSLDLTADTMVVLHSDHGWHLGEYAQWEKRTNWELGTRVPLIMRVPWMPSSVGKRSRALVELVDVYKTVCDIVGVPLPDDTVPIDGVSLRLDRLDRCPACVGGTRSCLPATCASVSTPYAGNACVKMHHRSSHPLSHECGSLRLGLSFWCVLLRNIYIPWLCLSWWRVLCSGRSWRPLTLQQSKISHSHLSRDARTSGCRRTVHVAPKTARTTRASKWNALTSHTWDTRCAQTATGNYYFGQRAACRFTMVE